MTEGRVAAIEAAAAAHRERCRGRGNDVERGAADLHAQIADYHESHQIARGFDWGGADCYRARELFRQRARRTRPEAA